MSTEERDATLLRLEHEVGVLVRRIRRVIGERSRAVHEDLQPASYLMLTTIARDGPLRASALVGYFDIDKGAVSRQVSHLAALGLLSVTRDPEDGRATLLRATDEARSRLADVATHRRKALDERLGDWDDAALSEFVDYLGRYNVTIDRSREDD